MAKSNIPSRACKQCGKIYEPYRSSQKFCSATCAQRNAYERRKSILTAAQSSGVKSLTAGIRADKISAACKILADGHRALMSLIEEADLTDSEESHAAQPLAYEKAASSVKIREV